MVVVDDGAAGPTKHALETPNTHNRHTMNAKVVNATSDHLVSAVDPAPADADLYSTSVLRDYDNYRKRTTSFGF